VSPPSVGKKIHHRATGGTEQRRRGTEFGRAALDRPVGRIRLSRPDLPFSVLAVFRW